MDLKTYLKISRRNQAEFAAACKVTPGRISQLVSGKNDPIPSISLALRIRDASGGAVGLDEWKPVEKAAA